MAVSKDSVTKDKDKALEQVLCDIEKQFGKGSIMRLGDNKHMKVDVCSSGCLSLDIALGVGGYPKGRIIEIYVQNQVVKLLLLFKQLLLIKEKVEELLLLMLNMR